MVADEKVQKILLKKSYEWQRSCDIYLCRDGYANIDCDRKADILEY